MKQFALVALLPMLAVSATAGAQQTVTPLPQAPVQAQPLDSQSPPPPTAVWNGDSQRALETAKSGTTVTWKNPDDASTGQITPAPAFQNAQGQFCREFEETVTIGGQPQQAYGTACRQPDGTWQLQRTPTEVATAGAQQPQPGAVYALPAYYYPSGYFYPQPFYSPLFIGFHFGGRFHGHDRDGGGQHHHH
jgi:hypothetical protein